MPTIGEKKTENGIEYEFNSNSRWERVTDKNSRKSLMEQWVGISSPSDDFSFHDDDDNPDYPYDEQEYDFLDGVGYDTVESLIGEKVLKSGKQFDSEDFYSYWTSYDAEEKRLSFYDATAESGEFWTLNDDGDDIEANREAIKDWLDDKSYHNAPMTNAEFIIDGYDKYQKKTEFTPDTVKLPGESGKQYYQDINSKHFGDISKPGSQITGVDNLDELLKLAHSQKKEGLAADDRDWYISQGVNPEALREGIRYIKVDVPGRLGASDSTQLSDDDVVTPIRKSTSKGADEYRFSVSVPEKPEVNHATIIISDDVDNYQYREDDLKALNGRKLKGILFTCYAGSPGGFRGGVRDEKLDKLEQRLKDPTPLTVREVRDNYFDGNDFGINYSIER